MRLEFSGRRAFIVQRLSALVLLAVLVGVALRLALGPPPTFAAWQAWSARPLPAAALWLFALALLAHAWVGIRDVVLDYVRPDGLRPVVLGAAAIPTGTRGLKCGTTTYRSDRTIGRCSTLSRASRSRTIR